MRNNYIQKLSAEEQRRADWNAAKQASIEARIRAGEEKAEHIKEVQQMMEMTLEARKNEIIGKEREHDSIKEKADAEREVKQRAEAAEKEMKQWTRRLQQARHQRRAGMREQSRHESTREAPRGRRGTVARGQSYSSSMRSEVGRP